MNSIADEFDILGLNYGQRRYDMELKYHPKRILFVRNAKHIIDADII